MSDFYICDNCGRTSSIKYLSKLIFNEADKKKIMKSSGWITTPQGRFCPACANPRTRKLAKELFGN